MAQTSQKFNTGLVLGKFYPLTKGHQYLIETAQSQCDLLYIAVGSRHTESIPPQVRARWITQLYPRARVVVQSHTLPYVPEECPTPDHFYRLWAHELRNVCNGKSPDALFTSEDYGNITAQYLGSQHIMVDRYRRHIPISATAVRQDPFAHWQFLDPVVRPYFVKTICLYGPESTGKTTLSQQLAHHFHTTWQPEWARDYLGERHCNYDDMAIIAREHFRAHAHYQRVANKILFMDTDAITTLIYSEQYYDRTPKLVTKLAQRMPRHVALYLFTDIDIHWVPDTSRDLGTPAQRNSMRKKMLAQLKLRSLPYIIISGQGEIRLQNAINAVKSHFSSIQESTIK